MRPRGWAKPTDRHKFHYFEDGRSLCLRYHRLDDGEFGNERPTILDVFDDDGEVIDMEWDSRFCLKCQWYGTFGKSIPPHLPKCERCGQFTSNPQWHQDPGWFEWIEYCYCERCENETTENRG